MNNSVSETYGLKSLGRFLIYVRKRRNRLTKKDIDDKNEKEKRKGGERKKEGTE